MASPEILMRTLFEHMGLAKLPTCLASVLRPHYALTLRHRIVPFGAPLEEGLNRARRPC